MLVNGFMTYEYVATCEKGIGTQSTMGSLTLCGTLQKKKIIKYVEGHVMGIKSIQIISTVRCTGRLNTVRYIHVLYELQYVQ